MRVAAEVIRPSDVPPQSWANGLGVTRVLVSQQDRRISVAEIEGTTRFSLLPGMDRLLIPVTAAGLPLDVGGEMTRLRAGEAATFRGEDAVTGHAGMRRALVVNIMTRRASAILDARIVRVGETARPDDAEAIVVLGGLVALGDEPLPAGTVILRGPQGSEDLSALSLRRGSAALLRWRFAPPPTESAPDRAVA